MEALLAAMSPVVWLVEAPVPSMPVVGAGAAVALHGCSLVEAERMRVMVRSPPGSSLRTSCEIVEIAWKYMRVS